MALACSATLVASCGSSPLEPGPVVTANQPAPTMLTITPTSGPVGTQVTVTGAGFQQRGNHLKFGTGYIKDLDSTDGVVLRFTIPDGLDLCAPAGAGPCAGGYPQVFPGDYEIAVMTSAEGSRPVTFTVTRP